MLLDWPLLTNDEAYSWRTIQYSFAEIVERARGDANPPLSYLLQRGWAHLAGESIGSLRLFSLLLFLCAIGVALCCLRQSRNEKTSNRVGSIFLAVLIVSHPLLLRLGVTARMYALGILLTGITSFCLLRSLEFPRSSKRWLLCYGVASAAFVWTHYYAVFTIFAQLLFAVYYLRRMVAESGWLEAGRWITSACWGAGAALILSAPCWPLFLSQQRDVQDSFWIPSLTWEIFWGFFVPWSMGINSFGFDVPFMVGWLFAIVFLLWHSDRLAMFFFMQAAVPWGLAVGYSLVTGRSIVFDRYLSFACYSWLCFLGVSWTRLAVGWPKVVIGAFIAGSVISGGVQYLGKWPTEPPAHAAAAHFLKQHYQNGDVCWTDWAPEVNTLRYYLAQVGMRVVNVRCRAAIGPGHVVHQASLSIDDFFWGDFPEGTRIWKCGPSKTSAATCPPGMVETLRHTFEGPKGTFYNLILFQPAKK